MHNINYNQKTKRYSFAAAGEPAWHKLGHLCENAMTAAEAIENAGLDFTVEKRPIYIHVPDENDPSGIQPMIVPNQFATVRSDTNQPLGIVKQAYEILQNSEAFEFFDTIVDKGEAIYQTAGALGNGEQIFLTAKLPDDIIVRGEQINQFLLLTTSHDGTKPTQVGFTPIRVVCNNTLTAALKGLSNSVRIMHFRNAKQKLMAASQVMGISSKYSAELNVIFNRMAEVKITDKALRTYIENVMRGSKEVLTAEQMEKEFSTRFVNQVDEIMDFHFSHGTQLTPATKGTVWGAYNAISGYYSYLKTYKSQDDKMKDVYFNGGARKIETAFSYASDLLAN